MFSTKTYIFIVIDVKMYNNIFAGWQRDEKTHKMKIMAQIVKKQTNKEGEK